MKLHVTLVQQSPIWHDSAANRQRLDALLAPLANNTDVIVLPEMFTTGFSMEPEKLFEPVNGQLANRIRTLQLDQLRPIEALQLLADLQRELS